MAWHFVTRHVIQDPQARPTWYRKRRMARWRQLAGALMKQRRQRPKAPTLGRRSIHLVSRGFLGSTFAAGASCGESTHTGSGSLKKDPLSQLMFGQRHAPTFRVKGSLCVIELVWSMDSSNNVSPQAFTVCLMFLGKPWISISMVIYCRVIPPNLTDRHWPIPMSATFLVYSCRAKTSSCCATPNRSIMAWDGAIVPFINVHKKKTPIICHSLGILVWS